MHFGCVNNDIFLVGFGVGLMKLKLNKNLSEFVGCEFGGWLAGFLENKANISPGKLPLADIDIELG